MSGDLIIEHVQGTLSYVHDEVQPRPSAIVLVHYDDGADVYVRHSGYMHRFIGRVPDAVRNKIRIDCYRAFSTFIPDHLVEDMVEVSLNHWHVKDIPALMAAEIIALWKEAVQKYGYETTVADEGEVFLTSKLAASFVSDSGQGPFADLMSINRDLAGNGSTKEFKEVIGQPIGGLAGARTAEALKKFFGETLVRN